MAEQLGEAVLQVSADTKALEAALAQSKQKIEEVGQTAEQAFSRTGRALQTAADGTQYFIDAQGRARNATGQFLTLAQQQAAGIAGAFQATATGAFSTIRSIDALREKLTGLRSAYESVQIGSQGFRQLQQEIRQTERELQRVDKTLGSTFGAKAGAFGSSFLGALGIGAGLSAGAAAAGFLKGAISEAVELETVTKKLTNALGQQGAGGALNFTRKLADDLGLSFKTLADTYSRFTAAATASGVPLETQRSLFTAVSRAAQALGLSNEDIRGTFVALQQTASKGVVSMDELRQQLGDRLPLAIAATAKGLGISERQLFKLVETGRLSSAEFFPALTKGLNDLVKTADGFETTAQKMQKLTNAIERLQQAAGKQVLPAFVGILNGITEALNDADIQRRANELGLDDGLRLNQAPSKQIKETIALIDELSGKFNVTEKKAKELFQLGVFFSGGSVDPFGVSLTNEQFEKLNKVLPEVFANFRKNNKDQQAEAQRLNAQLKEEEEKRRAALVVQQRQLDLDLKRNVAALEFRNLQDKLSAVRLEPTLDDRQKTQLRGVLELNEQIRKVETARLQLRRELEKPEGAGDGRDGTQSLQQIATLQQQIRNGEVQTAIVREQNRQADAEALRNQQERIRQQGLDKANADAKLSSTERLTELERQALATGVEVAQTTRLRLELQERIGQVLREQQAAQEALAAEQSRPRGEQNATVLESLFDRLRAANANVRQAYADAGQALVKNAREAASALRSAAENIQSILRGGFEFLTPELQAAQVNRARASIQPLVDRGVIRTGLDISTPEKLFQLAGFAESFSKGEQELQQALSNNAEATQALIRKDWNVYVQVPAPAPALPTPRA